MEKLNAILNFGHAKVEGQQHTSPKTNAKPQKADPPEVEEIVSRGDDNQQRKKIAQTNLSVLVRAILGHYGKMYNLEADEIEDTIKSVDDWEDKLGAYSTKGNSGTMQGLNEDLRNFRREATPQMICFVTDCERLSDN
ncbi:MAG: hypothetical protein E7022_01315 [Desulfovibrio desulfuricans]|nr:hypothetical protein [Desulfovibrio desulfuricans]